ncbi:MAG: DNA internalization-related competence protein ComEC/Rec2 [Gemmatimonadetes bacterium]|nr:DNA internalization-related competence protein ComEC/Rec2 [Gemmatimonadota bacterium]
MPLRGGARPQRQVRSFASRNPSFIVFVSILPGLLLVQRDAVGKALLLQLTLAVVLLRLGWRSSGLTSLVLAGVLFWRATDAREERLAEIEAWRSERAGRVEVIGVAQARGPAPRGRVKLLFRVDAIRALAPARAMRGGAPTHRPHPETFRRKGARETSARRAGSASSVRAGAREGWVRLYVPDAADLRLPPLGRRIRVRGSFRPAATPHNPGSLDWGSMPGGPRVRGSVVVESWEGGEAGGSGLLQAFRERLSERIRGLFSPLAGGFMQAALFGDREGLDPRLREVFSRTGTGHIIAISGMNVAILAAIGWAVLSPVIRSTSRRRRVLAGALLLYVPLGGSSPSVARAALMAAALLLAKSGARRVLLPNALGFAGLALLCLQPEALLDPSFQLSFLAVLGLAALPALPGARLAGADGNPDGIGRDALLSRAAAAAIDLSLVTVASMLATLPLTLGYFRQLPLVAPLANLIVVPSLGVLTAGGFAALLTSPFSPQLAALYAGACDAVLLFVFRSLELCAAPAWATLTLAAPRELLAGAGIGLAALGALALHLSTLRRWLAGAVLVLALMVLGELHTRPARLEVAVLSVGQGDAVALLLPDGEALLVDGGPRDAVEAVVGYLHERGVGRLARVFATHPDADHTGALHDILQRLPADSAHDGGQWGAGAPYRQWLEGSYAAGAGYRALAAGERLRHGEVTIDVLWPDPGFAGADPYWQDLATNDASLVLLVSYRRLRLLLTGDVGAEVERRLAAVYGDSLRSVFLKVAHHGSRTSSDQAFLARVRPRVALLSVGRDNRYGHPHAEVLARLAARGAVRRTDTEGALLLVSDGYGWKLQGWASGRTQAGRL